MKKTCIVLLFVSLMMQGCSYETQKDTVSSVGSQEIISTTIEESLETEEDKSETGVPKETSLELADIKDYAPVYYLTLKKIEGETGDELNFNTTELSAEPADSIGALMIEDPNNSNTLSFSFWVLNNVNSIKFTIENLEYNFDIPKTEFHKFDINQTMHYGNYNAIIKSVEVYPKAVALHISNISDEKLFENSVFLKVNNENIPPYDFYDEATEKTLLFVFEEEITAEEIVSVEIGNGTDYATTALELQ